MDTKTFTEKIQELKKEIPYQWRVQSLTSKKDKMSCVAYIDARDAMNRLDEVFGAENWQDEYKEIKGNVYCGVSIKDDNGNWVTKWDAGAETDVEKEKGESSDSFKRACVKWGLGRFLYDLDIQYVPARVNEKTGKGYPVDDNGSNLYNVTEYINNKKSYKKAETTKVTQPKETTVEEENAEIDRRKDLLKQIEVKYYYALGLKREEVHEKLKTKHKVFGIASIPTSDLEQELKEVIEIEKAKKFADS